jgi:hypothetical protein
MIVEVEPLSNKAKNRFANEMDKITVCVVEHTEESFGQNRMFLRSFNGKYFFWITEQSDINWKVLSHT